MTAIFTQKIKPQRKLFHNEWIDVYPTTLALVDIHFWKENNRTIFTFERLCSESGKKLKDIPLEDIVNFVASQDIHKIQVLADSIGRNGVQVPLVIRDDGKLLDGNRRFFACQWLRMQSAVRGKSLPESLGEIPVQVIKKSDLTETLELKILAEANFIPDLKVAWPLDAQARAVEEYYENLQKNGKKSKEAALAEVVAVFGINRQRAVDLLDTLKLTKDFISEGKTTEDQMKRRAIVEDKFVYLWEFRNKAMKGSGAYEESTRELQEVKEVFFNFMAKGRDNPIKNVKQIEPLVQSRRDNSAWSLLKESKGSKLRVVVAMVNEKKEVRKAEDKIRVFLSWLREARDLTPRARSLLFDVAKLAEKTSRA